MCSCLSGGAVASTAPTKQKTNRSVHLRQVHPLLLQLSPLGFAACQSKSCTNQTKD